MKKSRSKYIIAAGIILLLITPVIIFILLKQGQKPDPESEKIIREIVAKQLNKDPNDLTDNDYLQIKELFIYGKEICDIKLLDKFINLVRLDLAAIEFSQDKIPKWMKLLEKIGIINTYERFTIDLSPLEKLTKLQVLNLSHMTIIAGDIGTGRYISGIKFIRVNAPFKNLEPLSSLVNLKELDLTGALVCDLGTIKKLTNLEKLNLSKSKVSNLKPLDGLVKLKVLELTETTVKDLEPLKNLSNLEKLYLGNTQVSSLKPLIGLKNLETLQFFNTQVSDLEPLKGLTNLKDLTVWSNKITNIEPLGNLEKLEKIILSETQVYDIKPLKELKNLQNLYIRNCPNITDQQAEDLQKALPNLIIER